MQWFCFARNLRVSSWLIISVSVAAELVFGGLGG